jgi:glycosyltransferase involved in cell wall biosynthesis
MSWPEYIVRKHEGIVMITISLCMIVKNEEDILGRCLEGFKDIVDEMIVVDTGSTDKTIEVAKSYGAKVYEFEWINDFSAARNYSFSKATCDFIYSADADEVIDEENQERFIKLKEDIDELDIDIVQMYYTNQLSSRSVYNYDRELRPKLFRRIRHFLWCDPIHEQVKLQPTVCDSDVEIIHMPKESHTERDLASFRRAIDNGHRLSRRLHMMYARELLMAGSDEDFILAKKFFIESTLDTTRSTDEIKEASVILTHIAILEHDIEMLLKFVLKDVITETSSEVCYELGKFYQEKGDYDEAIVWFFNAGYETQSILDIHRSGDMPRRAIAECYRAIGNEEQAKDYDREADSWQVPQAPLN